MDRRRRTCRHSEVPTPLTCVRCGTSICPACFVRTDVGFVCDRHVTPVQHVALPPPRRSPGGGVLRLFVVMAVMSLVRVVPLLVSVFQGPGRPVSLSGSAPVLGGTFLRNPAFEDGPAPDGGPVGWTRQGDAVIDAEDPHGGLGSGRLRADQRPGAGGAIAALDQCVRTPSPAPQDRLRLSAFVRSEAVTGDAVLFVRPAGAAGALDDEATVPLTGTSGWTRRQLVTALPAGEVCVGVRLVGAGTLWLDDFELAATGYQPLGGGRR